MIIKINGKVMADQEPKQQPNKHEVVKNKKIKTQLKRLVAAFKNNPYFRKHTKLQIFIFACEAAARSLSLDDLYRVAKLFKEYVLPFIPNFFKLGLGLDIDFQLEDEGFLAMAFEKVLSFFENKMRGA